ncbi:nucleotidyltransferase domain-containing protein [Bradyrhizobium sp. AUGA SZCCT0042]|uniref:nucleotidyltransferase domain-containing protein n=1 Tax=Bradyrhizobium sp. AUGA SZCCT0042 TaxID=2807651 RepID=UPI001BABBF6F|nr:nucleotidyltransferase domain-containing protein [Bradyrhizobium sp. AUGA SZCCT0042]MBR1300067.1 nucleotidyltransferase domain-containing protein [Bradyrhizobium sp. AUGA SZCCT0042]
MQVSKSDTLAGLPLIKIRDFLRRYPRGYTVTAAAVEANLGLKNTSAEVVLQAMVTAGFLERKGQTGEGQTPAQFAVTVLGSRLSVARFVKRITRAKADALVREMLDRVTEINQRDELVFRVKRVRAFGSYAGNAPEVGDIDLAVDLEQRHPDRDIIEQLLARADASGKSLNTYMARLSYGELEVQKLLKGGSPYISNQSGDCPEKFGVPAIDLFLSSADVSR